MGLELDEPARRQGERAVPVVLHDRVVDDELVVEVDRGPGADLADLQAIPLAERHVGQDEWVLAGRAGAVVPEAARALVRAELLLGLLGRVPDLDLRRRAEVDAAVGLRDGLVVDPELDVAVFLVGRQVGAMAVVDELAVLDRPVLLRIVGPLGGLLLAIFLAQLGEVVRAEVGHAVPAGEGLAVEEGDEALGGLGVVEGAGSAAREQGGDTEGDSDGGGRSHREILVRRDEVQQTLEPILTPRAAISRECPTSRGPAWFVEPGHPALAPGWPGSAGRGGLIDLER